MSEKRDQERRGEVRYAVLAYLHDRPGVAQSAATICRGLRRELVCEVAEVEAATIYLSGDGHLEEIRDQFSSIKHYRITTSGTRAYEETLV